MAESRDASESFGALFEQGGGSRRDRSRIMVGDRVEVTIVAVGQSAVFADLGRKQEGFFERPDVTDADGKLAVSVGSKVQATVSSIDRQTGQVRLSPVAIRSAEGEAFGGTMGMGAKGQTPLVVEGARIKGSVTGVERYGVFVQIAGTQGRTGRGLIPTSETATPRGADLKKHFAVGQEVEAKIVNIDPDGKIRLSVSAIARDEERSTFEKFKEGAAPEAAAEPADKPAAETNKKKPQQPAKKPEPRNFGTFGDLLGKKIKK
jgi:small subunit ribosomal protein S1